MLSKRIELDMAEEFYYILDSVRYTVITELAGSQIESVWVNIQNKKHSLALGVMYRPPSSNNEYFDNIFDQIDNVISHNDNIFLMGDLNEDYKFDNKAFASNGSFVWHEAVN